MAAGLSLLTSQRDVFSHAFNEACTTQLKDEDLIHELIIDAWLDEETLDDSFHQCLNQLALLVKDFENQFCYFWCEVTGSSCCHGRISFTV